MRAAAAQPHAATPSAAPSLRIGAASDSAEREADAVAANILSGNGRRGVRPILSRSATGAAVAPDAAQPVGAALAEPGQRLGAADAGFFGPALGIDAGSVRLHTGAAADQASRSVGARAFALGEHVVFTNGAYRPETRAGRHLLAHELAHVAQGGGVLRRFTRAEEGDIATREEVVAQATQRADATAEVPLLMSWGRFVSANGGMAAREVVAGHAGAASRAAGGTGAGASATPGRTNSKRYLFSCLCGLIDMRHFFQLMYIGLLQGNRDAVAEGREHELTAEPTSRFAAEDSPSNALGAYFGSQQSVAERRSVFVANLNAYLGLCRPIDYRALPPDQRRMILDWYAVDGTNPPAHPNEAAYPNMERIPACAGLGMFPFVIDRDDGGAFNRIEGVAGT